jgi:hypothetical protein
MATLPNLARLVTFFSKAFSKFVKFGDSHQLAFVVILQVWQVFRKSLASVFILSIHKKFLTKLSKIQISVFEITFENWLCGKF